MKSIIGKKLGMTSIFSNNGDLIPVTVLEIKPNLIVGIKNKKIIIGYEETRKALLNKPILGQYEKKQIPFKKYMTEIKYTDEHKFKVGDYINLKDTFEVGNYIDIQGITRGHGFTGAIKLWNFATGPKSHGAGYPHRYQGSLESGRGGAAAQKVWKGKKMSGRYGNELVTMANLEVILIENDKNWLLVKGSVPGRKNKWVKIKTTTRKNKSKEIKTLIFNNNND